MFKYFLKFFTQLTANNTWKKNGSFDYNWKVDLAGIIDCTFPHSLDIFNHLVDVF